MPIPKKTAASFATDLENGILSRSTDYDVKVGPIADIVIAPTSSVMELQNERIRIVQQLLYLQNTSIFTDEDIDNFVFNETIVRHIGARATGVAVFSRVSLPTSDITIKANFPIATLPDEETNVSITFVTVNDATLVAADAASYFNLDTNRYELQVPIQALVGSVTTNVAANRVKRPLRALNGFDEVFNRDPTVNGKDPETNDELVDRYYLSLRGSSPAVVGGIKKFIRDLYTSVYDINVVWGNDPLNVRSAVDGGAVDVYFIGSANITVSESIIFAGVEQVHTLSNQPVISITSAGAFIQGIDFELVNDTSGYKGSIRASDGIKWLSTGSAPAVGDAVTVTYQYNSLAELLQAGFVADETAVPGRDILMKEADKVNITLQANLKVRSGFNVATVVDLLTTAILDYVNGLKLNGDVEESDIQAVVRRFSSVDNFVFTVFDRVGSSGNADVTIDANEYARLEPGDLVITIV